MGSLRLAALTAAVAFCAAGCPPPQAPDSSDKPTPDASGPRASRPEPDPLVLAYDPAFFGERARLLDRLRSSPFAYFRYLASPFAQASCESYADEFSRMPSANIHGDLHLEQYAVADDGFGLVDFDDATKGPPLLDWLRFTTSIWLASGGDESSAEPAISRFVEGYRKGLSDPDGALAPKEPSAARRIREGFNTTPVEWLDQVTAMMQPLDEAGRQKMGRARQVYIAAMLRQNPDVAESFFAMKSGGALHLGIGSANETKFLVRVEGPTQAPDDDVIIEKKQMKHQKLGRCVTGDARDPTRVIDAQSKFSRSPQRFLGYVEIDGESFYVQAWRVHYTELRIENIQNKDELAELAFDIGMQLGRGHPFNPPKTEEGKLERERLAEAIDKAAPELAEESEDLAERVLTGYRRFRDDSAAAPPARAAALR